MPEESAKEGEGVAVRIAATAAAAVREAVRDCLEGEIGRCGLDEVGGCGGFDRAVAFAAEEEEMADGEKRVAMAFWM